MDKELYRLLLDEKEAVEKAVLGFQQKMRGTRIEGDKAQLICVLDFLRVQHISAVKELMRMLAEEGMTDLDKQIQDLRKAEWYINDEINRLLYMQKIEQPKTRNL